MNNSILTINRNSANMEPTQISPLTGKPVPSFMLAKAYIRQKERKERKINLSSLTIKKKEHTKQQDLILNTAKLHTAKITAKDTTREQIPCDPIPHTTHVPYDISSSPCVFPISHTEESTTPDILDTPDTQYNKPADEVGGPVSNIDAPCEKVNIIVDKPEQVRFTNNYKNLNHDDTVFYEFKKRMPETTHAMIDEFLHIFYYLIVCYSKHCFKRDANWVKHNHIWNIKKPSIFNYTVANDLMAHQKLLTIQSKMYEYRATYLKVYATPSDMFIKGTINEFEKYVGHSLYTFATDIISPIQFANREILALLQKYKDEKYKPAPAFKSARLNYDALAKIQSNTINID
jgi:hypothetical protein